MRAAATTVLVLLMCSVCCRAEVPVATGGVLLKHDLSTGKRTLPAVRDRRLWEETADNLLTDILRDREECSESDQLSNSTKVVVSIDQHVWSLFLNWLAFYVSKGCGDPAKLHVICMDEKTRREIRSMGLICSTFVVFHADFDERMIWHTRFNVVGNLLMRGFDVVVSDVDAVWLNPVAPHINSLQDNTVLAATRCRMPQKMSRAWGAALNFGFLLLRSVEMALLIQEAVSKAMKEEQLLDDQIVLNRILWEEQLQVEKDKMGLFFGRETRYGGFPVGSRLHGRSVAFLAPEFFPRNNCHKLNGTTDVVVLHCAHKTATFKRESGYGGTEETLKRFGAWYK